MIRGVRPSLLLSHGGHNVVIDTTPDFRTQALRAGIDRLDAVLLTHRACGSYLGFDDLRRTTSSSGLQCRCMEVKRRFRICAAGVCVCV